MDYEKKPSREQTPASGKKSSLRNSNAAQVAQRRREERVERVRLENLRQKQTRKAKKRNKPKRRISRAAVKRILIMLGILLALIFSMVIFFRVRTIGVKTVRKGVDVSGNGYYTAQQIIEASGLEEGDNLLLISRADIAGNIMAKCPYVSAVQVSRQLPNTVQIHVEEYDATYAVRDGKGEFYLMTAGGKVTEKITDATAAGYIRILDMAIQTPTVGQTATVMAPDGQETEAQAQMDALKLLLQQIEAQNLIDEISSVSVPSAYEISVQYADRFTVKIGDANELQYKIAYLKTVVESQKPYATGTIDLSNASEGKVTVALDQE